MFMPRLFLPAYLALFIFPSALSAQPSMDYQYDAAYSIALPPHIEMWYPSSDTSVAFSDAVRFMHEGAYGNAITAWENAERVWLENHEGAALPKTLRYIRFQLAEAQRLHGRPEEALTILAALDTDFPDSEFIINDADSLGVQSVNGAAIHHAEGAAFQMLGQYDSAAFSYDRAFEALLSSGDTFTIQASIALRSRAELCRVIGDIDGAARYLDRAMAVRKTIVGETGTELAPLYRSFAAIALERWDLDAARRNLNIAYNFDVATVGENHPDAAADIAAAAILLWRSGDYAGARNNFSKARLTLYAALGQDHPEYAWIVANQGDFYFDIGMFTEAEAHNSLAVEILEGVYSDSHIELAALRFNLARSRAALGYVFGAAPEIDKSLGIFRATYGIRHPWTLEAELEQARVLGLGGFLDSAVIEVTEAVAAIESYFGETHPEVARALRIRAQLLRESGRPGAALAAAERAIVIDSEQLGRYHPETARSLWERVAATADLGGGPIAASREYAEYLATVIPILSSLEGPDGLRFLELRDHVEDWALRLAESAPPGVGGDTLRAESLREYDRLLWLRTRHTEIDRLSDADRDEMSRIESIRHHAETLDAELGYQRRSGGLGARDEFDRVNEIRALWSQYARARALFFESRDPVLWRSLGVSVSSARTLSHRLLPGECYVRIADGDSATLVYLATRERLLFYRADLLDRERLRLSVGRIRELLTSPPDQRADGYSELTEGLARLYAELFGEEIGGILALADTVHVAPSGVLFYLPFEALDTRNDDEYQPWGVTTSVDYIANPATSFRPAPSGNEGMLLYANPSPPPEGAASLEGAEREAELISRVAGNATLRTQAEAMKASLAFDLDDLRPDVLVISAHAVAGAMNNSDYYSWDQPNFEMEGDRRRYFLSHSGIFLAPSPDRGDSYGVLTLDEILDMRPTAPPSLVVLSACQTALGDINSGDEVMHMAEAFRGIGASHVMATLWSVDDYASAKLVVSFFRNRELGMSESSALRRAKKELWTRSKRYRHPYFWAGYILYRPVF